MSHKSLFARKVEIAQKKKQLEVLSNGIFQNGELPLFSEKIQVHGTSRIKPKPTEILQLNLGYMCNQVCEHCHVDAGPDRKEIMDRQTMQYCLDMIQKTKVHTVDLTGGAPEMNPNFQWFVEQISACGVEDIIVRSNLTILRANKKYYTYPLFFKEHNVHVVSSLPHWTSDKTDRQRGKGVFGQSIEALQKLNSIGYGLAGSGLRLDLVYNPSGAFLPGDQKALEAEYKKKLSEGHGIDFHNLFVITNLPISRFLDYLLKSGNYEEYMYSLVESFNPVAVKNVMCTNTISVDWQGYLYDCDFNQMLGLKVAAKNTHISEYDSIDMAQRDVVINQHCYGCTACAGSSCQGSLE